MAFEKTDLIARILFRDAVHFAAPLSDGRYAVLEGNPLDGLGASGVIAEAADICLLTPVAPSKIVGIGANFAQDLAAGTSRPEYPNFFIMPPSALAASGETVVLPPVFKSVLAEGELGVVLSRRAKNLTREEAADAILGFTIVNDFSGRDSTLAEVPNAAKKSCDGFAPMGPYLHLDSRLRDFEIETRVNGELKQRGSTKDLLFGIVECLCHVSSMITLEPYDVISMGTPPPKPKLVAGDEVSVSINGLGTLVTRIGRSSPSGGKG